MNILLSDTSSSVCITIEEKTVNESGISLDSIDAIATVVGPRIIYRN